MTARDTARDQARRRTAGRDGPSVVAGDALPAPVDIGFSVTKGATASEIFFSSCCFFNRQPKKRSFSRVMSSLLPWILARCSPTYLSSSA
jgi:hypothetical protein